MMIKSSKFGQKTGTDLYDSAELPNKLDCKEGLFTLKRSQCFRNEEGNRTAMVNGNILAKCRCLAGHMFTETIMNDGYRVCRLHFGQ